MRAVGSAWERSLRCVGIKGFRFHDLRHTWASWHVMSGTSLQELMELGSWNSYAMVLRYAHLALEHFSSSAKRIERDWGVVETNPTISLHSDRRGSAGERNPLLCLARPERFELPTFWFVARHSIQLSYGRA